MKNTKIVFFGSDSWSIHVLKALEDNFEIIAVVTAPNSPVSNYFKGLSLTPDKLDENFNSHLSILNCQLFVVASYGKIIPKSILDIPKYGALNVHPSLLPKYRGPSPVPATILNGDKETGVTIIKMDKKMDHGSIVSTKKLKLSGQEDFTTLINKLFQLGAEILVDIIPDFIAGKLKLKRQNNARVVFCPMLKKEDGYFDINDPLSSEKLDRIIRAYHPWPGVWTRWNAKIVKFLPIPRHSEFISESLKEILKQVQDDDEFLIQMEGKKPIPLKDFLNGYPDFPLKNLLLI